MRASLLTTAILAVAVGTAGCDSVGSADQLSPSDQALTAHGPDAPTTSASPDLNRELAALRRLVAPFHNFDRAQAAGWDAQFTPCLELPGVGGMGFHYGNPGFVNDGGDVAVLEPELLLFEPQSNGQMRFVGVEYVVLFSDRGPDQPAPVLFGQEFHPVPSAGLWGLHVWVGRHNPDGIFADWNPLVTCANAPPP